MKPLPVVSIIDLFEHIEKTDACWIWHGYRNPDGYGVVQKRRVHRLIYEAIRGPIPDGLVLDHLCSVRHCVKPSHLEPVTIQENVRRAFRLQTRCKHGHKYTPENTYRSPTNGRRRCRECARERYQRSKARW